MLSQVGLVVPQLLVRQTVLIVRVECIPKVPVFDGLSAVSL